MTTQTNQLDRSLQDLLDHHRITMLVSTLGRLLDERDFDALGALFADDATVATPGGIATGPAAIAEQARRRHSVDDGIQHLITNVLVAAAGDRAEARANLMVAFARTGIADPAPFLLAEVYRFALRRTGDNWQFTRLATEPVWSLNRPSA